MKKFSKLLAVLVAIAVIICPMTSAIVANATSGGSYSIVAEDANNVVLTINSEDGFIVYQATVTFNNASAFQSSYSSDGYTNGLKVVDYTLASGSKNAYNAPAISAQPNGNALVILVAPTDAATLDLYSEIQIGIRVASGSTANLTKIQAADEGTVEEDPSLLNFGAKVASDGTVTLTDNSDATTGTTHEHNFTKDTPYEVTAPTCTAYGVYRKTCTVCGAVDSSATYTGTVMAAHTPSNVQNATEDFLASAATCTAPASYYYECTVCHDPITSGMAGYTGTFTNGAAAGHTMTAHAASAATCTEAGNTAYWSCSVCNKYFSDAAGNTEIVADSWIVPATGHTSVTDPAVAATCTNTGLTAGAHCSVCNAVLTAQTVVPATGHSYSAFAHDDASDPSTHSKECSVCHDVVTEACDTAGDEGACSVCGYKAAAAECTHTHKSVVSATPATEEANGSITFHCDDCDEDLDPVVVTWRKSSTTASPKISLGAAVRITLRSKISNHSGISEGFMMTTHTFANGVADETDYDLTVAGADTVSESGFYNWEIPVKTTNYTDIYQTAFFTCISGEWTSGTVKEASIQSLLTTVLSGAGTAVTKRVAANLLKMGGEAQATFVPAIAAADRADNVLSAYSDYVTTTTPTIQRIDENWSPVTASAVNGLNMVAFTTPSVVLADVVAMDLTVNPKYYSGSLDNLTLHISYYSSNNIYTEEVLQVNSYDSQSRPQFRVAMNANNLRSAITVQVYSGEAAISPEAVYSIEGALYGATGTYGSLINAILNYSDAVAAYVG